MVKELDKEKLDKSFDELAMATWRLYNSMRKVGFSRKESYGIARDWFLACVHQAHQQSSIVSSLLQNIHIPTKPV
jgi:hypothetical protein